MDVKDKQLSDINREQYLQSYRFDHIHESPHSYSAEDMLVLMAKLPRFAPKPVCRFLIDGRVMFGKLECKKESFLYIRHIFGKKAVKYHKKQVQFLNILRY